MKKRLLLILCTLMIIVSSLLYGCSKKEKDPNEATYFLKNLDSYSTNFNMEIKNDRQTINYTGKQYYLKNSGYRLDLGQDRVFVYKDDKIFVNDIKNKLKYTTDRDFDVLFRLSLIQEYIGLLYTDEDIKYSFKDSNGIKYELIDLVIPGTNREISKAVLYINLKDYTPERIIIYDVDNKETVRINYTSFAADADLKEDMFKVQ